MALRPDHRSDLRRLLEHWLVESIVGSRCRSRDDKVWWPEANKQGTPRLGVTVDCLACREGRLVSVFTERREHRLECTSSTCAEVLVVTHCRHCQRAPLIKRASPSDMLHDAVLTDLATEDAFINARCPWCESYL